MRPARYISEDSAIERTAQGRSQANQSLLKSHRRPVAQMRKRRNAKVLKNRVSTSHRVVSDSRVGRFPEYKFRGSLPLHPHVSRNRLSVDESLDPDRSLSERNGLRGTDAVGKDNAKRQADRNCQRAVPGLKAINKRAANASRGLFQSLPHTLSSSGIERLETRRLLGIKGPPQQ
jgi:hypothetical protein